MVGTSKLTPSCKEAAEAAEAKAAAAATTAAEQGPRGQATWMVETAQQHSYLIPLRCFFKRQ
jgi:hypothetical protein